VAEQERREPESPDEQPGPAAEGDGESAAPEEARDPLLPADEDAAWAQIVAGYGAEPPDPPGAKPFRSVRDLALPEPPEADDAPRDKASGDGASPDEGDDGHDADRDDRTGKGAKGPLGSSVSFAPGVAAAPGPRDYRTAEPSEDDFDGDDEGHFVPPEPPPLPEADVTSRFAWLAVVGGPVLLLLSVLLGWDMTWWLATLCIGGFLGGFATLVARMQPGDDEDDDPGRGAVV
jgi:hypothetical protein